jgi:hypothetical protein
VSSSSAPSDEPARDLGWHVISGELLLDALRRVGEGEDPDLVYAELWANASHDELDEEE